MSVSYCIERYVVLVNSQLIHCRFYWLWLVDCDSDGILWLGVDSYCPCMYMALYVSGMCVFMMCQDVVCQCVHTVAAWFPVSLEPLTLHTCNFK